MVRRILSLGSLAVALFGADFTLSQNGLGPITVHTELEYEGRGERLRATATNDTKETLPMVRMCVHGSPTGCLFTLWNQEPWKPGETLEWNLDTRLRAPDLGHEVLLLWMTDPRPASERPTIRPEPIVEATAAGTKAVSSKPSGPITIQVVGSGQSTRSVGVFVPGTATQSSTSCAGTATTASCNTVTNPGSPARIQSVQIPQAHVQAIMPDGRHIALWCQNGFRRCATLEAGNYAADVSGNALWVHTYQLDGKLVKIKFQYVGSW